MKYTNNSNSIYDAQVTPSTTLISSRVEYETYTAFTTARLDPFALFGLFQVLSYCSSKGQLDLKHKLALTCFSEYVEKSMYTYYWIHASAHFLVKTVLCLQLVVHDASTLCINTHSGGFYKFYIHNGWTNV